MRIKISKSKNASSLYVIEDITVKGKRTTRIVEKLGTVKELQEKLKGEDPIEWARAYAIELTEKEFKEKQPVLLELNHTKKIEKGLQNTYNGGYLFLQQIYHDLGLDKIFKEISEKYKFTYNLDSIVSRLIYGRILHPSSKLNTFQESKKLLEEPDFELHHVYRALEVLGQETDFIQAEVYKNSKKLATRNDQILYYDCTNYYFEIENSDGLKQYGLSKENKPNPIVGMGLFMDGDGIPLAFNIFDGNKNEQITLKPLEEKILKDFDLSRFIVCTDAGLSSNENRIYNTKGDRAFVTTQSVKKLKNHLKEWALDSKGWKLTGSDQIFDISIFEENPDIKESYKSHVFYKERWIKENGLEQKLIVTFSLKYKDYHQAIRLDQVERAKKAITNNPSKIGKARSNDFKRFIESTSITKEGEIAKNKIYDINQEVIEKEAIYDGFYAICTNLEDSPEEVIKINHRRWKIEECFRIMKTEFKARPVFLSRDDRIKAHFTTCFLSLIIFRYLEKHLDYNFTCREIINSLKNMNFLYSSKVGFIPSYTRTDFTDKAHDTFGFRTDYEVIHEKNMNKIFRDTKKAKSYARL